MNVITHGRDWCSNIQVPMCSENKKKDFITTLSHSVFADST